MNPDHFFGMPPRPSQVRIAQGTPGLASRVKNVLLHNFEMVLVLVLLGSLFFINYFVVHKFAFLLFYFIPVLLAGFYLSARHAVMTAVLSSGFVVYFTLLDPFGVRAATDTFSFWNLLIWACFLTLTGALVGQIQEKNRLHAGQLRDAYLGIIQILVKYLETADQYTKSHSERVATVCSVLARRLGLSQAEVQNVWSAALLHDIGKIEVIELVRKEAALTDDEKAKIDQHTELGAQLILTTGTVLNDVIPLILDHHRPYQDGGDSIPLGARIITVADTYDAVLTDRPYRAGRMHFQAVEILEDGAGKQFDPKVVQALKESETEVVRVYQEMPVSPAR
jgi:putative nucleotidyltransferase with HDIG domain